MKKLIYPAILWLLCILSGATSQSAAIVPATLISLSFIAIGLYLPPRLGWLFCVLFEAVTLLWAPLLAFLPLCFFLLYAYDLLEQKKPLRWTLGLFPLLISLPAPFTFFTLIALSLLGVILAHSAHMLEQQKHRFYALMDDALQKERSLEQKNKALLEKQDYQVQLATLSERGRLAREIHDNVGHLLTRALFQVSALQVVQPENKEALGMVKTTLEDAMTNIRASVHDLHDEALNLELELQKLIDAFPACPVTLRYNCQPVPAAIHYCFIAVVKEALSNIARHSNATTATISVWEHPSLYQLIIEDNGRKGSADPHSQATGIGLHNIHDRVTALHGNFVVQRDHGFRLFISIPKNDQEDFL